MDQDRIQAINYCWNSKINYLTVQKTEIINSIQSFLHLFIFLNKIP